MVLVEGIGMGDKRVEIQGRELLVAKREHVSAHSGSSLQSKEGFQSELL
jgi:hypothetical protein